MELPQIPIACESERIRFHMKSEGNSFVGGWRLAQELARRCPIHGRKFQK
jgi:hypothetical protein